MFLKNKIVLIVSGLGLFGVIVFGFNMSYKDDTAPVIQQKEKELIRVDETNATVAKEYGLLENNLTSYEKSWHLDYDEKHIYTISTHYDKNQERYTDYSYIDVFDINTLQLLKKKKIHANFDTTAPPIIVDDKDMYIGGTNYIVNRDKTTLECYHPKVDKSCKVFQSTSHSIRKLSKYKDYIFAFGEGDQIYVFENRVLLYTIDERYNYPKNITTIKDYSSYNRINDIVVHQGVVYALNWRGFINEYDLKSGKFLRQINDIKYDKEYDCIAGDSFNTAAIYNDRYIYFAQEYDGVLILDTKTRKFSRVKSLFKKGSDKATSIYKMMFYKDNLIFSEVNMRGNFIYVYSLKSKKIIYRYKGHKGDVSDMFIKDDALITLSTDGYIYKWNLGGIKCKK